MKWILSIGIIVVAGIVASYILKTRKKQSKIKLTIPPESVVDLSVPDVVGFFRSMQLDQTKDQPFISTSMSKIGEIIDLPTTIGKNHPVLLGVYDSKNDEVNPLKLLMVENIGQDILDIIGDDPLVILS